MFTPLHSDAHNSPTLPQQGIYAGHHRAYAHVQDGLSRASSRVCTRLTRSLQAKNPDLYMHSFRVYVLVSKMVTALRLSRHEQMTIELAAFLHDIGKVEICDNILNKPCGLTEPEFAEIRKHPVHGAMMIHQARELKSIAPLIYYHHERWDGRGYPDSLRATAIPIGARIIAIADAFDVITSGRPYHAARSIAEGLAELSRCAGTQFDPSLVDVFCQCAG